MFNLGGLWQAVKGVIWFFFGITLALVFAMSGALKNWLAWLAELIPKINQNLGFIPWEARGVLIAVVVAAFWKVVTSYMQ